SAYVCHELQIYEVLGSKSFTSLVQAIGQTQDFAHLGRQISQYDQGLARPPIQNYARTSWFLITLKSGQTCRRLLDKCAVQCVRRLWGTDLIHWIAVFKSRRLSHCLHQKRAELLSYRCTDGSYSA